MNAPTMNAANPPEADPQAPKSNISRGGCRRIVVPVSMLAGVLLVISLGFGIYILLNFHSVYANFIGQTLIRSVNKSAAPPKQKTRMNRTITRVVQRYKARELSDAQLKAMSKQIFSDPSINARLFYFATKHATDNTDLQPSEKTRLDHLLRQLVQGLDRGQIDSKAIADLAPLVSNGGQPEDELSKAEARSLVKRLDQTVNQGHKNIEPVTGEVDLAARFDHAVSEAVQDASKTKPGNKP